MNWKIINSKSEHCSIGSKQRKTKKKRKWRNFNKKNKMVSCVVEIRLDLWNEMQIESSRAHPETMRANRAIPWLLYEFLSLFLLPSFPFRFADNSRINSQQIEIKTGSIWMQFTLSIHFVVTKKKGWDQTWLENRIRKKRKELFRSGKSIVILCFIFLVLITKFHDLITDNCWSNCRRKWFFF